MTAHPGDPAPLFDRLRGGKPDDATSSESRHYPTAAVARHALSLACVSLGRGLVGLGPLKPARAAR